MQITITGGTGSLSQYIQKELSGQHDIVLFDRVEPGKNRVNYEITAPVVVGDLTNFEDCQRAVAGSQAVISTAKAAKVFGWKAAHSWTDYLPVAAAR